MMSLLKIPARTFASSATKCDVIKNVTILGGGLMGSGIAQVAAATEHNVTVVDKDADLLINSTNIISKSLTRVAKKKFQSDEQAGKKYVDDTMNRVKTSTDIEQAVANTDLVIEAVSENLALKKSLFSTIDAVAPKNAVFVSNSSSIPISDIAAATKRLDQFGGLHFFNPVPVMKLVELVRINETNDTTFNKLKAFSKKLGKTVVSCKDTSGFVVNRLLVPYLYEAVRMYERGDADFKDIDTAMKLGCGYPMGPFELIDVVGLDTMKFIYDDKDGWHTRNPDNPLFNPSPLLNKMVEEGKLGRKSGEGFYKYNKK
ncbi:hydroxyacyl-coenzyme A dehydrogenase, mitochondrial-like [Tubulanus polymorphus]|uniref:hydroxyacyl-coenzyme A dehydrogenase, mitochondrial-like n=1 Tax=Tubulanus polymorphus TaxID=672921 RepID=UPI003DA4F989